MYSKSSYRPRRTRIYAANYDIGESYYKQTLDYLDNKSTIRFSDKNERCTEDLHLERVGTTSIEGTYPPLTVYPNKIAENEKYNYNLLKTDTEEPMRKISSQNYCNVRQDSPVKVDENLSEIYFKKSQNLIKSNEIQRQNTVRIIEESENKRIAHDSRKVQKKRS